MTLDLIHEFDFAEFWFGPMASLAGYKSHVSALEIDTDDLCRADSRHENAVVGKIELNYFDRVARRNFEILFTEGQISGDLMTGNLIWAKKSGAETHESHKISRDDLHDRQTRQIFGAIQGKESSAWNPKQVRDLMLKVLAIPFVKSDRGEVK